MEITLPLEKMTTEDKIRTMETLRDDLCKKAESIPSELLIWWNLI